jgi:hypothetical protein
MEHAPTHRLRMTAVKSFLSMLANNIACDREDREDERLALERERGSEAGGPTNLVTVIVNGEPVQKPIDAMSNTELQAAIAVRKAILAERAAAREAQARPPLAPGQAEATPSGQAPEASESGQGEGPRPAAAESGPLDGGPPPA